MNRKLIAPVVALCAFLSLATPAQALSTATRPTMHTIGSPLGFNDYEIRTTVTLDAEATVTITSEAYRHPVEVEYSATLPAGTHTISIPCSSTRLPHAWPVYLNGVKITSASLKCE